jgi:hypothetical protein
MDETKKAFAADELKMTSTVGSSIDRRRDIMLPLIRDTPLRVVNEMHFSL